MNIQTRSVAYVTVFLLIPLHAMHKSEGIRIYNFIGQHNTTLQKSLNVPAKKKVDPSTRRLSKRKRISIFFLAFVSLAGVYYYLRKQCSVNNQAKNFYEDKSTKNSKHTQQNAQKISKILKHDDKGQPYNRACFYDIVFKIPKILKRNCKKYENASVGNKRL